MTSPKALSTGLLALLLSAASAQAQVRSYVDAGGTLPLHHLPRGSALEFMSTEFFPNIPCPRERDEVTGLETGRTLDGVTVAVEFQGGNNLLVNRAGIPDPERPGRRLYGSLRSPRLELNDAEPYCRINVVCNSGDFTLGPSRPSTGGDPIMGRRVSLRTERGQMGAVVCTGTRISTILYLEGAGTPVRSIECSSRTVPPVPVTVAQMASIIGSRGAPATADSRVRGPDGNFLPGGIYVRTPNPADRTNFSDADYRPGTLSISEGCPGSVTVAGAGSSEEGTDAESSGGSDDDSSPPVRWTPRK